MTRRPIIITFYSFKGGVGRTQALANVAVALANKGRDVLLVDMDLESPGLHTYFSPPDNLNRSFRDQDFADRDGLIDFLEVCAGSPAGEPRIEPLVVACEHQYRNKGRLRLLSAGRLDHEYPRRVAEFSWEQFYATGHGYQFLELMRNQLLHSGAEFVLIDSRTGMTDIGAVCTFQLPEAVVILFALHAQGIEGARRVKQSIQRQRASAPDHTRLERILLVPSRVDEWGATDLLSQWIKRVRERLGDSDEQVELLDDLDDRIPYLSQIAYGEQVIMDPGAERNDLSRAYQRLTDRLDRLADHDSQEVIARPMAAMHLQVLDTTVTGIKRRIGELTNTVQSLEPANGSLAAVSGWAHQISSLQALLREDTERLEQSVRWLYLDVESRIPDALTTPDTLRAWHSFGEALQRRAADARNTWYQAKQNDLREQLGRAAHGDQRLVDQALSELEPLLREGRMSALDERLVHAEKELQHSSLVIRWNRLSEMARRELDQASGQTQITPRSHDELPLGPALSRTWNRPDIEAHKLLAQRLAHEHDHEDQEQGKPARIARAHFLLASAKLRLFNEEWEWARILFVDALRWIGGLRELDAWRDFCAQGLLLSVVVPHLPAHERKRVMAPDNLDVLFLMPVGRLLFVQFERMRLFSSLALATLDMEPLIAQTFFRAYLATYFVDHPASAEGFLQALIEGGASQIDTTLALLVEVFDAVDVPFAAEARTFIQTLSVASSARQSSEAQAEQLSQLRQWLLKRSDWTDFTAFLDKSLQAMEKLVRKRGPELSPELTLRILTPNVAPDCNDRLVIEVHYLRGDRPLPSVGLDIALRTNEESDITHPRKALHRLSALLPGTKRELSVLHDLADASPEQVMVDAQAFVFRPDGAWREVKTNRWELTLQRIHKPLDTFKNPYVTGIAVGDRDSIFGREEQIKEIIRALMGEKQDNPVLVHGERRIGKTTLLNAVEQDPLICERYLCVRIDLQRIQSSETTMSFFREFLVEPVQKRLKDEGIPIPALSQQALRDNPAHTFRRFMMTVDQTLGEKDLRLLIVIDELEKLLEEIDNADKELDMGILATLRAAVIELQRVSFILCGVTHVLRQHTEREDNRLFKLAVEIELRPLNRADAEKLVRDPANQCYKFVPGAVDQIVRETGRHPYLVQYVCYELFQHMVRRRATMATVTDVEEVLASFLRRSHGFSYLIDYLSERDLDIVRALAARQYGNMYVAINALPRQLYSLGVDMDIKTIRGQLIALAGRARSVCERKLMTDEFRLSIGLFAAHLRARQTEDVSLIVHSQR